MFDYLSELFKRDGKLRRNYIKEIMFDEDFSENEKAEIERYIIENRDYSVVPFRFLDDTQKSSIIS